MAEMARVKDEPLVYLGHPVAVLPGAHHHPSGHAQAGSSGLGGGSAHEHASHHDSPDEALKTINLHLKSSSCRLLLVGAALIRHI